MLLEIEGVTKTFGAVRALSSASLSVAAGTVHGLVGPNGAGKSTLVKVASGQLIPDHGEVRVGGRPVHLRTPTHALANGIVAMPQELILLPDASVAENILLGWEPSVGPFIWPERRRTAARKVIGRLGLDLPLDAPAVSLRPSDQRLVMLARALARDANLLILDEPTAAMSVSDADLVLSAVESLRDKGISIIYVSHRFDEITRVCDFVTVMRDGQTVSTASRGEISHDSLVEAVVSEGNLLDAPTRTGEVGPVMCELKGIHGQRLNDVTIDVHGKEVLGIIGLAGAGGSEVLEILAGVARPRAGQLVIQGRPRSFGSPADAVAAGVGYLAERGKVGFPDLPVRTNTVISKIESISFAGEITARRERRAAGQVLASLGLRDRVNTPLSALSGGNKQKVLVARSLFTKASVLVLDDPTAGVDVGARSELHRLIRALANEGKAIVMSSSEPEELAVLADRVVVLNRGHVQAVLAGPDLTPQAVLHAATGGLRRSVA